MQPESLLTAEIQSAAGVELEPDVIAVEQRMMQRILKSTGDTNPRWEQEVPPAFLLTWMMSGAKMSPRLPPALNWLMSDGLLEPEPPFTGLLDGGGEWEFLSPIRLGDIITSTMKIANIRETSGRMGRMLIVTWERAHTNQRGEQVAVSWGTLIGY
ncbi:MAG: MaoC family dehydratase N-terminal domain-containing protein [Dehalococcoidia bacterium]|nr:MaoC family dehydratase N-terminal domain-containing protein [Dehalococcoidia bacterium]